MAMKTKTWYIILWVEMNWVLDKHSSYTSCWIKLSTVFRKCVVLEFRITTIYKIKYILDGFNFTVSIIYDLLHITMQFCLNNRPTDETTYFKAEFNNFCRNTKCC